MSFKEDPLEQRPGYRTDSRTLFLEREGMLEARENFWQAYRATIENEHYTTGLRDEMTWNIAWAAAIAAFSFIQEGRIRPK